MFVCVSNLFESLSSFFLIKRLFYYSNSNWSGAPDRNKITNIVRSLGKDLAILANESDNTFSVREIKTIENSGNLFLSFINSFSSVKI